MKMEYMDKLIPLNFVEVLGGTLMLVAILSGILSLFPALRAHSLRLLALFFVCALAMFANHWSTYFASIFVIATAVTELEFLQNLAAIIRGNKDYFDYKKESLSYSQKEEQIVREQQEIKAKNSSPSKTNISSLKKVNGPNSNGAPDIRRIIEVESKALDKMESYFGSKVERNVRVSSPNGMMMELDGLIPSVVDDMISEKIIEIKYISNPEKFERITRVFPKIENQGRAYSKITKKIAKLHFVLVIEGKESLSKDNFDKLKLMVDSSHVAAGYSVFTTQDLGLD
jgi:hypothetical protein